MQLAHTVEEVEVFHVEGLDVVGELVVVGPFAGPEVLRLVVVLLELAVLPGDGLDLPLHLLHLLVGEFREAEVEELLEAALDVVRLALGVDAEVAVENFVARELEEQRGALLPVALRTGHVEPRLEFGGEIFVHIL